LDSLSLNNGSYGPLIAEKIKNVKKVLQTKLNTKVFSSYDPQTNNSAGFRIDTPRVQQFLQTHFPGYTIKLWTHYDSAGIVNGQPSEVSMEYISVDKMTVLIAVRKKMDLNEIYKILQIGKLYAKHNVGRQLCCMVVTTEMTPDSTEIAEKCKIKVHLVEKEL